MPAAIAPAPLPGDVNPEALLRTLLDISLTGILLLRPLYGEVDAAGPLVDFAYVHLNAAAQQMLQLPECPTESFLTLFPTAQAAGILGFYRDAFLSGQVARRQSLYQADTLDGYYHLVAQRQGPLLVVSFTDTNEQPRSAVEEALRASQTREQAARAEAERERAQLQALLTQAPVAIALFQGEALHVAGVNPEMAALWGHSLDQVRDRPLLEGVPELQGQGFDDLLRQVLHTREPVTGTEVAAQLPREGQLQTSYYNFVYQPLYDSEGLVLGVIDVAVDVTAQVLARQQVEQLNQELESRVQERTRQLSEQQALLGRILGQVPAAVATLQGPEHRYSFFNEQYQQLVFGRASYGTALAVAFPEVTAQGFVALLDQVYQTGQPYLGYELLGEIQQPDGTLAERYFNFVYQPLRSDEDQVTGILLFAVEVSEQVRARRQAEALQAELLAIAQRQVAERKTVYQVFTQVPPAVAILRGPEHRFAYVNPAYQGFFGDVLLLGRTVVEATAGMLDPQYLALLDEVYQTGQAAHGYEAPVQVLRPGGSPRQAYFNFTYSPYREDGQQVGICIFAYEMTEQVLARQEREVQRQLVSTVFEQAPAGIWVVQGPTYIFELLNPAMARILGHSLEQALGRPYFDVLPELIAQGLPELFRQVWEQGEPVFVEELPAQLAYHAPGERSYFTFVFQPLRDSQGQVTRIACVAQDVTTHVLARQQVQTLNEELATINEELRTTNVELHSSNHQLTRTNVDLDTFVYTASHDLKAPIANLEGLLEAIRYELPATVQQEEVIRELLRLMQASVERFRTTIDQLTDVSRLQQAQNQPAEHVQLAPVVESVRLDLLLLLQGTHAQLTIEIDADLTVLFSPKNLRSVIYNLLSNALKYHQPGRPPRVLLRAFSTVHQVVLTVADNGLGLTESQQQRLFNLFQRMHTHVEGTGVGLHMIKRMVENAGGSIRVKSQVEKGTVFQITLPTGTTP